MAMFTSISLLSKSHFFKDGQTNALLTLEVVHCVGERANEDSKCSEFVSWKPGIDSMKESGILNEFESGKEHTEFDVNRIFC